MKQARKVRAEHAVKCSLLPDRTVRERAASRRTGVLGKKNYSDTHCAEVYVDPEKTIEAREKRIMKHSEGDRHFTEEGRVAEITIDMVLQAGAKMSQNKVNGPEDAIVSEMIKQVLQEKIFKNTRRFQDRLEDDPSSWKIVKVVFLRKLDAAPKKGKMSYRGYCVDVDDVEVVCDPVFLLRFEKGERV